MIKEANFIVKVYKENPKIMQLNGELIDRVTFTARWLLKFCEEHNIEPPNLNELSDLIKKIREQIQRMDDELSDDFLHDKPSDGNLIEPSTISMKKKMHLVKL
jgi:hypothetical protein